MVISYTKITMHILYISLYFLGYHDEELSFGMMKKGVYKPASDFGFKFIAEVICSDPHSSGFLIKLTPDRGQVDDPRSTRCSATVVLCVGLGIMLYSNDLDCFDNAFKKFSHLLIMLFMSCHFPVMHGTCTAYYASLC